MPAAAMVKDAIALLRSALTDAPPNQVTGTDAATMVRLCAEAERIAAAAASLYAARVASTGVYEATGHRSAATWFAEVSGDSVGHAMGVLETTSQMADAPAVLDAFCDGRLSMAQAKAIAGPVAQDPSNARQLLESARTESWRELKARADRARREGERERNEVARESRAQAGRYLRTWEPAEGGLRLEAWVPKVDGAKLLAGIEFEADSTFAAARADGRREPVERYRADALVRLCSCRADEKGRSLPRVVLRVDAGALKRGSVEDGELCEIAGVGSVPLASARALLDDALVNIVVRDGIDITCVTSTTRTIPYALRVALLERDPMCVVPGCHASQHLEIHHWLVGHRDQGPTALANLARLCKHHHDLATYRRWRLEGGPGNWRWIEPDAGKDLTGPARPSMDRLLEPPALARGPALHPDPVGSRMPLLRRE